LLGPPLCSRILGTTDGGGQNKVDPSIQDNAGKRRRIERGEGGNARERGEFSAIKYLPMKEKGRKTQTNTKQIKLGYNEKEKD